VWFTVRNTKANIFRDKKIGLALGGGGVRGLAHIGVLKVLEQEGIKIDLIAGSSAGALIGGAYASGDSPQMIKDKIEAYLCSPQFKSSMIKSFGYTIIDQKPGTLLKRIRYLLRNRYYLIKALFKSAILPTEDVESMVNYIIPDIDIRQTRIPLRVVTTDLKTGEKVVFSSGPLRQAVLASCAFPGAIQPIKQGEWILADGGIASMVPVHVATESGADLVIGVTVDRDTSDSNGFDTVQDIVYRAGAIAATKLKEIELTDADVIIKPKIGDIHWMDFVNITDLTCLGEEATREVLDEIYRVLPFARKISRYRLRLSSFWESIKSKLHCKS